MDITYGSRGMQIGLLGQGIRNCIHEPESNFTLSSNDGKLDDGKRMAAGGTLCRAAVRLSALLAELWPGCAGTGVDFQVHGASSC